MLVFLFQLSIYVFVAPNFYSMKIEVERVNIYSTIQILCIIFYVLPFLLTYYYLTIRQENKFLPYQNTFEAMEYALVKKVDGFGLT